MLQVRVTTTPTSRCTCSAAALRAAVTRPSTTCGVWTSTAKSGSGRWRQVRHGPAAALRWEVSHAHALSCVVVFRLVPVAQSRSHAGHVQGSAGAVRRLDAAQSVPAAPAREVLRRDPHLLALQELVRDADSSHDHQRTRV